MFKSVVRRYNKSRDEVSECVPWETFRSLVRGPNYLLPVPNAQAMANEMNEGHHGQDNFYYVKTVVVPEVHTPRKREVIYVAHPVSGDPIGNCLKVVQWIKWLTKNDRTRVYIAPWVAEVLAFPEAGNGPGSHGWEQALQDDEDVIAHLDGILLVGGKITPGMAREKHKVEAQGGSITDMSRFASPSDLPEGFFLDPAYEAA